MILNLRDHGHFCKIPINRRRSKISSVSRRGLLEHVPSQSQSLCRMRHMMQWSGRMDPTTNASQGVFPQTRKWEARSIPGSFQTMESRWWTKKKLCLKCWSVAMGIRTCSWLNRMHAWLKSHFHDKVQLWTRHEYTVYLQCWILVLVPLKDAFKRRIEHIQMRARRNKMHVAKGFYTKEKMKESLEWSQSFSKYTSMCVCWVMNINMLSLKLLVDTSRIFIIQL